MLNSERALCEEEEDPGVASPNHGLPSSPTPPPPPPPPHPAPPLLPKMEAPSPLHHTDPMSLARLHLLNVYSRWPVPVSNDVDEYRVRWEGHASHLLHQVARLEQDPASADVTVATKGFTLPAHRIVLAAASKFFSSVLQRVPSGQHPVIVVRGADPRHLRCVITFCYTGTVTIPAQDVQQVVKLADDLEIAGLKVSCLTGYNNTPIPTSTAFPTPGALRPRLPRRSSPETFTFMPIHSASSPTTAANAHLQEQDGGRGGGEGLVEKRRNHSSMFHERQGRKRFKVESLPVSEGERETLPPSSPSSSSAFSSSAITPPGSAPPNLPSTSFFGRKYPSPPSSAPPHSIANHPPYLGDSATSMTTKDEQTPLSLVPSSRLIDPVPLALTTSYNSASPLSPSIKRGDLPSSPLSPSSLPVPNTPKSLNLALKEPLTPSTPNTPTTPRLQNEYNNSNRMGLGCNTSGCSTGSRVLLWRFLLDLLHNPSYTPIYIRWLDRAAGIFRIMESDMVAQLWGMARKNSNMNYEKMSRGMRTYYKRGILFHIDGTKLIYKFNTTDPEIQQRMRYYDLTQKSTNANDSTNEQQSVTSPTLSNRLNLSNLPTLTSLPNLPVAVTSSPSTSTIEGFYNPFFRDVPQLPTGLLYDPYITSFLRASQRELF